MQRRICVLNFQVNFPNTQYWVEILEIISNLCLFFNFYRHRLRLTPFKAERALRKSSKLAQTCFDLKAACCCI